jgi:hypothetical protein
LNGVTSSIQTQIDGKANTALSNLAAVAINTSLVSDTNNTDDLGSAAINWKDAHIKRAVSSTDLALEANAGSNNVNFRANKNRRSKDGSNFIEEEYFDALTLTASQTNAVESNLTFAFASYEGIEVVYKIKEATTNRVRIGTMSVVTNGTDISMIDASNETADVGVTWSAAINGANVEIRYTTTANNKTMRADVKRFRA